MIFIIIIICGHEISQSTNKFLMTVAVTKVQSKVHSILTF